MLMYQSLKGNERSFSLFRNCLLLILFMVSVHVDVYGCVFDRQCLCMQVVEQLTLKASLSI